jgi:small subunit ribosomal protein S30e
VKRFKSYYYVLSALGAWSMPTHGALSKAGKVRSQTPKIEAKEKIKPNPKARSRRNYEKRIVLQRKAGQNWL